MSCAGIKVPSHFGEASAIAITALHWRSPHEKERAQPAARANSALWAEWLILNVRQRMKLIEALLISSAGPEIRRILRFESEPVFTELLYVRLRRVAQQNAFCDVRACIAKLENGELAQDAVEVVFRCLEVSAVD